ncbi:MAG: PAS domain-containing protein [Myxococcota bacterium]
MPLPELQLAFDLDRLLAPPGGAAFVVDRDLRFVAAAGEALHVAGVQPSDIVGRTLEEALDPTRLARVGDVYREALAGRSLAVEHDFGGRRFLSRGQPLRDPGGAIVAALVFAHDVSAHERAAEADRRTEEMFTALVQDAPFGVFVVDPDLRIRLVNSGAAPMFAGIDPVVGRSYAELIELIWPPAEAAALLADLRRARDGAVGETVIVTARRVDRGRTESYSCQHHQIVLPEGERGVACYVHDLTAHREAQQIVAAAGRRDAFRLALTDEVRPLTRPDDIIATASALLGRELGVSRVAYATVAGRRAHVQRDWTDGTVPSSVGDRPLGAFTDALAAGRTVVVEDVDADPRSTDPLMRPAFASASVRSLVHVPLVKAGKLVALLAASHREPRVWTNDDVGLVEEVADRTWAAIEQAHAEHEVRQRTAQLQLMMANAPYGMYLVDQDLRILRVNDAARPVFGGLEQVEGRLLADVLHDLWQPAEAEALLERFRETLQTGRPYESPEEVVHRQGDVVVEAFQWRIDRIPMPDDALGIICYFRDVSRELEVRRVIATRAAYDHYRASLADALRSQPGEVAVEGARMLREHLGASRVCYVELDHEAQVADIVSEVRAEGVPAIAGRYPFAGLGPWSEALQRGQPIATTDVRTTEKAEAYLGAGIAAYAGVPQVVDGQVRAILGVHSAVPRAWTDDDLALIEHTAERTWAALARTRGEAALRASEARLQLALDAARMGTFSWSFGEDGGEVDDRFVALLGLPAGAPVDLVDGVARSIHPDDRDAYAAALARASSPGDGVLRLEARLVHPDGSIAWALFTGRTLFDGERPARLVGIAADVTQLKEVEQALREREERLEEGDRRKDEFLAILAHELRNPLAPIRTGLQVLQHDGLSGPALGQVRAMMERQVGHMVRLIDDLLDLSRITSGKIRLQREVSELSALVDAVVETNRPQIEAGKLHLDVSLPEAPVLLDVDPARFVQVLSNVVHNAVKFTDPGGRVALRADVVGDDLVVEIRDTGVGIEPAMLERVFELFAQVDEPELHGGEIHAHSAGRGQGSTFTLRVPTGVARQAPSVAPPAVLEPDARRRVVVIDDNRDAADAVAMLVDAMGGEARVAYDGQSGVALVDAFRPDLVLLDLGMPEVDGFETCRRLRLLGRADLRVVALTGWGQEQDQAATAAAGFDAHLTKPADPAVLERLIAGRLPDRGAPGSSRSG